MKLSVVINTKNSEKYIKQCLQSIKKIADEIIVVDMASTDKTLKIAQRFTDRIFQYPQPEIGYVEPAREFAFAQANGDWIFLIDSDEEIKPPLANLIKAVVTGNSHLEPAEAYFLARSNIIFDKAINQTGWYPDYQLRLWQNKAIKWQSSLHSIPKIIGKSGYFPSDPIDLAIVHHNYQTIEQFILRSNRYSTLQAEAHIKEKKPQNITPDIIWKSFFDEFWRRMFLQQGMLEGNHGIALSLLQASNELHAQAKVWQHQGFNWSTLNLQQIKTLRRQWLKEAKYWWAHLMVTQNKGCKKIYWQIRRKLKI